MITKIDVQTLVDMREEYQPHALIDVREKGEFVQKQIFKAVPLPRGQLELLMPERVPVQSIPLILYCDDVYRSEQAAETLEAMGYTDVRWLDGGLAAWEAAGQRVDYGTNVPGKDYGEKVAVTKKTPHLSAEEVAAMLERGDDLVIVDSRTKAEYEISHIPGAYSVPGGELPDKIQAVISGPATQERTIVVNCAGRTRSILGADVLLRMGIDHVYALENGTAAWKMAGFELAQGEGSELGSTGDEAARDAIAAYAERVATEDGVRVMPMADFERLRVSGGMFYVVDARLPEDYAAGHIPGSVSLPAGQMALQADETLAVNQALAVFVSNEGHRARIGASMARQLDYRNAYVLDGGINAWVEGGGQLVSAAATADVYGLTEATTTIDSIDINTLDDLLAAGEPLMLIDVRGSGDYVLNHIAGSTWIPRGDLERRIERLQPDRDVEIVVVCDNGVRSALAAATLNGLGYRSVRRLEGGVNAWLTSGKSTVEGFDGADVELKVAKDDVAMIGRRGPLARTEQDMIDYLDWEIALGDKYETGEDD